MLLGNRLGVPYTYIRRFTFLPCLYSTSFDQGSNIFLSNLIENKKASSGLKRAQFIPLQGQSNMVTIKIDEVDIDPGNAFPGLTDYLGNVWVYDQPNTFWQSLEQRYASGFFDPNQSELYFGLHLAKTLGVDIYLGKFAVNSSGFYSNPSWLAADEEFSKQAVDQWKLSRDLIPVPYEEKYIVTNMGEEDGLNEVNANAYQQNMIDQYDYFDSELGVEHYYICLGMNPLSEPYTLFFGEIVNQAKIDYFAANPTRGVYQSLEGYTMDPDNLHYFFTNQYIDIFKVTSDLIQLESIPQGIMTVSNSNSATFDTTNNILLDNTIGDYTDNFTIVAYGRFSSNMPLLARRNGDNQYRLRVSGGRVEFGWATGGVTRYGANVDDGLAHKITIRINGAVSTIAVDTIIDPVYNFNPTITSYPSLVPEINSYDGGGSKGAGELFMIGIYDSVLTTQEEFDAFNGDVSHPNLQNLFTFTRGASAFVDDIVTGNTFDILGANDVWAANTGDYHTNWQLGFDSWDNNLKVSFDINGNSIKTDGDVIAGYTWISRNPSGLNIINGSENDFTFEGTTYTFAQILSDTTLVKTLVKDSDETIIGVTGLGVTISQAYWWQGVNLNTEIENKIVGESNAIISNSHALKFDGASNFIPINKPVYTTIADVDITLMLQTDNNVAFASAYSEGNSLDDLQSFRISFNLNKVVINLREDSGVYRLVNVSSLTTVNDLTHTKIRWVDKAGRCELYINDVLDGANFNYSPTGTMTFDRASIGALGRISEVVFFSGIIYCFKSNKNGSLMSSLTLSEGDGVTLYDRADSSEYIIQGTLTDQWSEYQDYCHQNYENGFDKWIADVGGAILRVLFDINGISIKTDGDIITGYTWSARVAQTGSLIIASENIFTIDSVDYTFDELEALIDMIQYFAFINTGISLHETFFNTIPLTGDCLEKTLNVYGL